MFAPERLREIIRLFWKYEIQIDHVYLIRKTCSMVNETRGWIDRVLGHGRKPLTHRNVIKGRETRGTHTPLERKIENTMGRKKKRKGTLLFLYEIEYLNS